MIRNELHYQTTDAFQVVDCIEQAQVLESQAHDNVSYTEILEKEKLKVVEHRMKQKMHPHAELADEKVMCIACGFEHYKSERLNKNYGVLDTNHCPHCNCESFWKL